MQGREPPSGAWSLPRALEFLLVAAAVTTVVASLWRGMCLFPSHGWNEVRLAPVFQWLHGGTPYPPPETGPATTWIYGPIPLLLMSPVALAGSAAGALLIGAGLNIAIIVTALVVVCLHWPIPGASLGTGRRWLVALACVALWPGTAFRFFDADNVGVALGLLSLLCLARAPKPAASLAAAGACAAALLCKQTLLGLLAAQLIWLALQQGTSAAVGYAVRVAGATAIGLAIASALWGAGNIGFYLLLLPARQPWAESLLDRVLTFWPELLLQVALPAALLLIFRRQVWRRDSPWLLPALAWVLACPLDAAAFLKHGGSTNSLHGSLLLLPIALTLLAHRYPAWLITRSLAAVALACAGLRIASTAPGVWRPRVEHLRQGAALCRSLPGEVYFPWHPLVTFYGEGRIDEVEDGLFIRARAGLPVSVASAHLPPRFHVIAFRRDEMDWGIARSLVPAQANDAVFGLWQVLSWRQPR